MNRKMLIFIGGIAIVSIAVTAVTASSFSSYTPLYRVRMEEASSKMNFLPTVMNEFTYTAEKGCKLNYNSRGYDDATPLIMTWQRTCWFYPTCSYECPETNQWTCWDTC